MRTNCLTTLRRVFVFLEDLFLADRMSNIHIPGVPKITKESLPRHSLTLEAWKSVNDNSYDKGSFSVDFDISFSKIV